MNSIAFVRTAPEPDRPPPALSQGPVASCARGCFRAGRHCLHAAGDIVPGLGDPADPPVSRHRRRLDRARRRCLPRAGAGACWAYIWRKAGYFTYGSYPFDQRWRVDIVFALGFVLIAWLLVRRAPYRNLRRLCSSSSIPSSPITYCTARPFRPQRHPDGPVGRHSRHAHHGGVGIVFSLPAGVLLALGRRSQLPSSAPVGRFHRDHPRRADDHRAVHGQPDAAFVRAPRLGRTGCCGRWLALRCSPRPIWRKSSGRPAGHPRGQFEGAMALGLNYPQRMRLIILPQALTIVIPASSIPSSPCSRIRRWSPSSAFSTSCGRSTPPASTRMGRADHHRDRLRVSRPCSISSSASACRAIRCPSNAICRVDAAADLAARLTEKKVLSAN